MPSGLVSLAWLGQAGFLVRGGDTRVMIDPYLSDSLAAKYKGTEFPHERMMPSPIEPGDVRNLDWVMCSHRHSDHMDPGTLPVLATNNPSCRFIVPRAERLHALNVLGLPEDRLVGVNAGQRVELAAGASLRVVPAAHEDLRTNALGEHHFLGFVLTVDGVTVYHSGDCVPYDRQLEQLRPDAIDLALLPVNGRRPELTTRGFAGNMTLAEAWALCVRLGIKTLVPHHFGMFAFNTLDPEELSRAAAAADAKGLQIIIPSVERVMELAPGSARKDVYA
jgi:L-ascorbate metabolism protein UlaG (beta-lactamase superfamily)